MALRYGVGCEINLKKAIAIFQQIEEQEPNALFEIGLCFEQGILEDKDAIKKAMQYYELAYEQFCEEAIFQHFQLYQGDFATYPYQREIKEAYSFKLGQLMRIVHLAPSKDANKRVALMYENGYPGDNEEETKRFQEKAIPYRKAAETMEEEFIYGKMYTYVESRIYQDIICKKDMSFYDQSSFLKTCI